MQIMKMNQNEVDVVARFISIMNQREDFHIGYCGTDQEEIKTVLINELDIPYRESFLTAYENDELIGVIGFDADTENKSVEVWGPFISDQNLVILSNILQELLEIIPDDIEKIDMFPNKKNLNCIHLAKEQGFQFKSEQTILKIMKPTRNYDEKEKLIELTDEYQSDFIHLHQQAFPKTYYDSQQILDRLNGTRKVFIITELNVLAGYIYVEANPEFGEANIEFFAVKEEYRGKGLGGRLLNIALQWLFSYETIHEVMLCVNSVNEKAIRLYQKVGFEHVHDLCFFSKKMK
ncbi:MAG: GNAT family N-acetyltransferase [Heyndrickxia sp.]